MAQENTPVNTPEEPGTAPEQPEVPNQPNTGADVQPSYSQIAPLGTPHSPPADPQFTVVRPDEEEEVKTEEVKRKR